MKNLVYFGVIGLVVVAVILGYNIYQQSQVTTSVKTPAGQQSQSAVTKQSSAPAQKRQLTAEEKQVLIFPRPNATQSELKAHSDLVNKLGNQSGVPQLDITDCQPTPIVYRVKLGGSFKVKNSDNKEHVFYTQPNLKTTIGANSEKSVPSSSIGAALGDFGYNCDNSTSVVGIIQIVP